MRELKFRVWDKDLAKYLEGCEIDSLMAELSSEGDGRGIVIKQICPARYEFEQYTGLKDKNGDEIYEGDILEDGSGEPIEYWTVKFEDGKFIGSTQGVDEDIFELTDLEIIGNIHENPELLEAA